ncbi:ferric reduction oxidase 7, chloroplastic-like [Amaranthus tricolor]|uniref:ferric reduction oxidase 7, chloroplastic-like n=1 Tax=Amaranthus tricolor TaxID=29722 RepID=UPI0025830205|nr:ferric reduction oxidase 7, chloroplastic-like [Amaranthus tricolor]
MGEYSTNTPLLSSTDTTHFDLEKKSSSFLKLSVKWVLKLLIWVVFISWISLMFFYPSKFVNDVFFNTWVTATKGTFFGLPGSLFFAFSAPVLILAFLAVLYLLVSEDQIEEKKTSKCPSYRLWTFPVLVNGPFGVVTAAELIGILLVVAFVVCACIAYGIRIFTEVPQRHNFEFSERCLKIEIAGAKIGLIGLFCLSLLFIPISRGSMLLRLVDIPFEHATRYHVWLGHLTMVLFTLHGVLYVIAWAMEGRLIEQLLEWKDIGVANLAGVISLAAGILMWVTSLPGVRTKNFELFFYTHQLYVVFVIFLALHVGDFIFLMGAGGIFLFILDRFLRFIQSRKTVDVISATSLPCGTVELVLSKPACLKYNALSFIFLQVRELSWLQWHPFSVSSSPLEGKYHLSVLIKVLGEWTDNLKGKISNKENEPQKLLEDQLKSVLTASVEGPYGHESPYHLTYKYLVLVAGGIGISPFLAILSDVIHRLKEGKPCTPKNIMIVWAIKKSDELTLLSMINTDSIDPIFYDALNLDIQIYVTRETEPKLEEGNAFGTMNTCTYPISKRSAISVLVGTGDTIWSGLYIVASSIGFLILLALVDLLYINPKGIVTWWYKGFLVVVCMLAGVAIFGGLTVALWHRWERRMLASESHDYDSKKTNKSLNNVVVEHKNSSQQYLVNSSTLRYGCRPNFEEIFASVSDNWGAVDVGVLVCGPETLTSSVAKEIRSHSLNRKPNHPIFHFNSHSFDL